jgi:hypothetical protein
VSRPFAAAVQLALIAPAAVFLLAVAVRAIGPLESEPAQTAQAIVTWYSGRVWTLWVLLLALPMGAFVIGGATLAGGRPPSAAAGHGAAGAVAVATIAAGAILAVVILHMLAN